MSTALTRTVKLGGVLTDVTSMTCVVTYGSGTVVANVATHPSTGVYTFTVIDPAYDLTYTFTCTTVYAGETYVNAEIVLGVVTPGVGATVGSLESQIVLNLEGRVDLGNVITGALADACEELSSYRWRELVERDVSISTTAGVHYITLPADVDEVLSVWLYVTTPSAQRRQVELISEAEAHSRSRECEGGSEPTACYREGQKLYFLPEPSSVWTVKLIYRAFLTVDSGAASADGFDGLLIAYATAQVYESIEHGKETASRWWSIYNRRLQRKQRSQETTGEDHRAELRLRNEKRGYTPRFSIPGRNW
jgi:hypothetical protein